MGGATPLSSNGHAHVDYLEIMETDATDRQEIWLSGFRILVKNVIIIIKTPLETFFFKLLLGRT